MIKWLLPLLLLAFLPAKGRAITPTYNQMCFKYEGAMASGTSTSCTMQGSFVAGQKVIAVGKGYSTNYSLTSATEALTCPAGANINHNYSGASNEFLLVCYVDMASSHSTFTCTLTNTTTTSTTISYLGCYLYDAGVLGSGIDVSNSTFSNSTSVSTTGSGRLILSFGSDDNNFFSPSDGFSVQRDSLQNQESGSHNFRVYMQDYVSGAAGSYTASYSSSNSQGRQLIVLAAFPITAANSNTVVETCAYGGGALLAENCLMYNVPNPSKIIWLWHARENRAGACAPLTGCTCPAAAQVNVPASTYSAGLCYIDISTSSNNESVGVGTGSGNTFTINAIAITGLQTGADTSSAAAAANASSVNYTPSAGGEYTFGAAGDNASSKATLLIGNSFIPIRNTQSPNGVGTIFATAYKISGSGSQTISVTGNTAGSVVFALSFPLSASTGTHPHAEIVKAIPLPTRWKLYQAYLVDRRSRRSKLYRTHKIPWNRPREMVELEERLEERA